ncbi:MAG: nucleotidyltransferase family protein [Deltaproteobacteria bacterium]|nr:MAG: nucleotidyltransferase family protein [Deltaproteobacteria bacterium]
MKAVILAAGLGTRLRPLSHRLPKPLFPILNRPLLGLLLEQLQVAGFHQIGINTHHQAAAVQAFVAQHRPVGLQVYLSHEPTILGTGGGLKKLANFLGDQPFLVINGDILTDLHLTEIYQAHQEPALATLVLHDCPRFNHVWENAAGQIVGFGHPAPADAVGPPLAFTGVQVVSPRLLDLMPSGLALNIIDQYREAIAAGEQVAAHVVQGHFWQDIGTLETYREIHRQLLNGDVPGIARFFPPLTDPWVGAEVTWGAGVRCAGGVSIGSQVQIGPGVRLQNTVIWDQARIDPDLSLTDCIVGPGAWVRHSAQGQCMV